MIAGRGPVQGRAPGVRPQGRGVKVRGPRNRAGLYAWRSIDKHSRWQPGDEDPRQRLQPPRGGRAFGDLGTLIPFVVGYLTIARMDPVGVLVAFGLFKIAVGFYFKTPLPIQPMKAIGTAAISQPGASLRARSGRPGSSRGCSDSLWA
jgi:hypothetical protein